MKLNLEVELDWIDDEMNLDDTIKQNIIDAVIKKIEKNVESQVEKNINKTLGETIVNKINEMTENLFNDFMNKEISLSDRYGDKIEVYPNVKALIKKRFDNFMEQTVDENGKTYEGSYGTKYQRIYYIIDKQLKSFANKFTEDAVKTVSSEIKEHVKEGLTTKLGAELMKVLKVNDMLKLT
jgi:Zn/Cd-binding protein ZinT